MVTFSLWLRHNARTHLFRQFDMNTCESATPGISTLFLGLNAKVHLIYGAPFHCKELVPWLIPRPTLMQVPITSITGVKHLSVDNHDTLLISHVHPPVLFFTYSCIPLYACLMLHIKLILIQTCHMIFNTWTDWIGMWFHSYVRLQAYVQEPINGLGGLESGKQKEINWQYLLIVENPNESHGRARSIGLVMYIA